jgi:hypothetical protein
MRFRLVGEFLIYIHYDVFDPTAVYFFLRQIGRVVQQLQSRPYYLFLYLDALMAKDPNLVSGFADIQVNVPSSTL